MPPTYSLNIDIGLTHIRILWAKYRAHNGQTSLDFTAIPAFRGMQNSGLPMLLKANSDTAELMNVGWETRQELLSHSQKTQFYASEFTSPFFANPQTYRQIYLNKPPSEHPYNSEEAGKYWLQRLVQYVFDEIRYRVYPKPMDNPESVLVQISYPHGWTAAIQNEVKHCIKGIFKDYTVDFVPQHEAAVLGLAYHGDGKKRRIPLAMPHLVVDIGAMGTSVSLVEAQSTERQTTGKYKVQILETKVGDIGGDEFDRCFTNWMADVFNYTVPNPVPIELWLRARELKEFFSVEFYQKRQKMDTEIHHLQDNRFMSKNVVLSHETFMYPHMAGDIVNRWDAFLAKALHDLHTSGTENIIFTGGGSSWSFIAETVQQRFPHQTVLFTDHPDPRLLNMGAVTGLVYRPLALEHGFPLTHETRRTDTSDQSFSATNETRRTTVTPERGYTHQRPPEPPPKIKTTYPTPVDHLVPDSVKYTPNGDYEVHLAVSRSDWERGCTKTVVIERSEVRVTILAGIRPGSKHPPQAILSPRTQQSCKLFIICRER